MSIRQGETQYGELQGWHDRQQYDLLDNEGFATSLHSWDWRFLASDLPDSFEFREGGIIRETIDGVHSLYEVMPLGDRKCWEPADSSGVQIVVHTKQVR